MTQLAKIMAAIVALLAQETVAFTSSSLPAKYATSSSTLNASRRSFVSQAIVGSMCVAAATTALVPPALAIPSVTVNEFEQILKNSARSINVVEFSGPKGDIVTVKLADGTTFGISDIIESPTDPRSPLKLLATLRSYKVPCKFMTLENALSTSKTKRKSFANERVQLAAEKEREKAQRIAEDEAERQAELYKMEQEEATRKSVGTK